MDKQDIKRAVALACGFVEPFVEEPEWYEDGDTDGWDIVMRDAKGRRVPNYPESLDAMASAEKHLDMNEGHEYGEILAQMVRMPENAAFGERWENKFPFNGWGFYSLASMTAAEKAEAFLRAKKLYT